MSDPYSPLLSEKLAAAAHAAPGRVVWVVDEQLTLPPRAVAGVMVLSNRWDIQQHASAQGWQATLSDFDLVALPQLGEETALACVGYRVSKEKAVVHRVINQALARLAPGGTLWLAGHKQEGIRTYVEKAARCAGAPAALTRLGGGGLLAAIRREAAPAQWLDDQNYAEWRRLEGDDPLWTKPGIFGWQQIDPGSALLVEQLATAAVASPRRLLDLGCGYGYLAVSAARRWPTAEIVATDSNVAAVAAAARNLGEQMPAGQWQSVAADCGDQVTGMFDAVVCNPPFHRGFATDADLTGRFVQAAASKLLRGGQALFVVNRFIPLRERARGHFARAEVLADDGRFLVALLTR